MGALPDDSFTYECNVATVDARTDLLEMFEDISNKERADAYAEFESMCTYAHPITVNCYYGVQEQIDPDTYGDTFFSFKNIMLNFLYNAGYMYVDIFNIITNDRTTQDEWPYYLGTQVGDFLMRWIWRDETT